MKKETVIIPPPLPKTRKTRGRPRKILTPKQQELKDADSARLRKLEDKLIDNKPLLLTDDELEKLTNYASISVPHQPVIFQPNDGPQSLFLSASEREVLYGGAAGGGKTIGLIADALRDTTNGAFVGLVLRRTNDELREIISKTHEFYPKVFPSAKWSSQKSEWTFPSGARLWLTYLERDLDVGRYHGQAFSYIAFDELTQYTTPYAWDYLRSRLRTAEDAGLELYMRATTNPGGPGHQWVKKMFVDPAPWGQAFWATDIETGNALVWPEGSKYAGQPLFKRRFIPSTLKDNPHLDSDGRYEANLLSMPEHQRKQLLEGSWDTVEGAAFPEFNRKVHVIPTTKLPSSWRRFRAADYGYRSPGACIWFACSPDGQLYIYREMYAKGLVADKFANKILEMERNESISYGILDSSVFHNRGSVEPSIAEQMIRVGCFWRPSDRTKGSRIARKNELHRRLQVNEFTQKPGIVIMDCCVNTIAQMPLLQLDRTNPEDVDTKGEDHIYDAIGYGIASRPMPSAGDFTILQKPATASDYMPSDATFGY